MSVTADTITDEQIRQVRRKRQELIDMLMVAIHSTDAEIRRSARTYFAKSYNKLFLGEPDA